MSRRLRTILLSILVPLLVVGTFNVVVDPYDLLGSPTIPGWTSDKRFRAKWERLQKPFAVARRKPRALVIGTSRALRAFDPESAAWPVGPVYNLGMNGHLVPEILAHLRHALAVAPVEMVLVSLDLFSFSAHRDSWPGFDPGRLLGNGSPLAPVRFRLEPFGKMLHGPTLRDSWETVRQADRPNPKPGIRANGLWEFPAMDAWYRRHDGLRATFRQSARDYARNVWHHDELGPYVVGHRAEFREMVALAQARGIDLRFVVFPSHAWHFIGIHEAGLWTELEDWKRWLVRTLDEMGVDAPVFDFTGFEGIVNERVPPEGDLEARMRYYFDAAHGTRALGEEVLLRVFQPRDAIEGFGVPLDVRSIEPHLAELRRQRDAWILAHPDEYRDVAASAARDDAAPPTHMARHAAR